MASKWPGAEILVVMPSRLEAGASCFDHFLTSTSLTGEPLEYAGQELKAIGQLWSLIGAAGLLGSEWQEAAVAELGGQSQSAEAPEIILVGFSKGGVVLNQILADAAHCCCGDDSRGGPSAGGAG
eukprot:CAMPEP_0177627324 /NCGR_PEP_ID=MMETSP0419_2-20121207/31141_1 /TAXON_ID=582737 /ORGANISM="Tetraselmis sp., Strain GSL018" /LENGTH=124 /DNA_ID=CAMNT_0019128467 /DNA_START=319 /DNA_END=689 /DNA_ORIENTATION=+